MPNVDSILLRSLIQPSRSPSYGGYGDGTGRLIDLLRERAAFEGEAAQSRAANWTGALQGVGQAATGYMAQRQRGQRDQAWLSFLGSNWQSDPRAAYAQTLRIWGPEEGPKQWQGLVSATQLMQPKRDPEKDQKALVAVAGAYTGLSPEARAQLYPTLRPLIMSAIPGVQMPEQHDPAFDETVVLPIARQYAPKPTGYNLAPNEVRVEDGKVVARGNAPAPPAPSYQSKDVMLDGRPAMVNFDSHSGRYMLGDQDVSSRVRPIPPQRAEREGPRPVQIETTDEQGKPVTRFVTPTAGASYPKPTGAGRASTGQQKKALDFFNQGMEADRIASGLEESGQIHPAALRYTPDMANVLLPQADQQYRQAQRNFTDARLRKVSGATIKDSEYENDAKTYFPQPGDDEATKAQKRAARRSVLAGIAFESGDALREFYGDEANGMLEQLRAQGQSARPNPSGLPRVASAEDYNRLAPGAAYIDPNGVQRRKR